MSRWWGLAFVIFVGIWRVIMYREEYLDWLCQLVNATPGKYDLLLHELYLIDFTWCDDVPLDFNRAEDGLILRGSFHSSADGEPIDILEVKPCSVLEVLLTLSQKMDYLLDDDDRGDRSRIWFWELIKNLKLDKFTDAFIENTGFSAIEDIDSIVKKWLDRDFGMNGWGSPFPLWYPRTDQRKLQMIDQMNAYLLENYVSEDDDIM